MLLSELAGDQYFIHQLRLLAAQRHPNVSQLSTMDLFQLLEVEQIAEQLARRQASLLFDGETLFWQEEGHARKWPAWSGRQGYWSPVFQSVKNIGPLPQGFYEVRQNDYASWDETPLYNRAACILNIVGRKVGLWPGCTTAWGHYRVGLTPKPTTRIYNRSEFTIHGGSYPGSAGCIDLVDGIDSFVQQFREYGKDLLLEVRYKPLPSGQGYHRSRLEPLP